MSRLSKVKSSKDGHKNEPLASRNAKPSSNRWWIVLLAMLVSLSLTASGEFGPALVAFFVPRDYALCSRSRDIYTVDETQPRVECIAVRGSWILDAGDQGQYFRRFRNHLLHPCSLQLTYKDVGVREGNRSFFYDSCIDISSGKL
jgi:hypothetical protein